MDLGGVVLPLQGEKSGIFTEDEVKGKEKRMSDVPNLCGVTIWTGPLGLHRPKIAHHLGPVWP
jgi:hypothetical protein